MITKAPKLGKLYRHLPRWWHQAEPRSLAPESFHPAPEPSKEKREESRLNKLAEISLHTQVRSKRHKKAA
jgi:hypothetical protein